MQQRWANVTVAHPGRVTPRFLSFSQRFLLPLVRLLWRPTLTGLENLPDGPFLLVANHSAGTGVAEIFCFAALYLHAFSANRPLAGFAMPVGFHLWPLAALHRQVGTIPSSYEAAATTLAQGIPILVFPGGDHESLKPIWQASRVDFAGRLGFLRIAQAAHVPVVPLGIHGGAMTAPNLLRSKLLANLLVTPRLLGTKRWAISALGLGGALAMLAWLPCSWPVRALCVWLWLGSPLTFLPWIPWTLRLRIGVPMVPDELFDAGLEQALLRVQAAVQAQVDAHEIAAPEDKV